jgi:hypothetical protein
MMAFVHGEMPVLADKIVDLPFADKALNQGDIDLTLRFAATSPDHPRPSRWPREADLKTQQGVRPMGP